MRLIDGHRGVEMPVCYLKRAKITAGEYLIFYRVAFRYPKKSGSFNIASPGSNLSSKVPLSQNTDGEANDIADAQNFFHEQRKIVLSLHFPAQSKLQMQRVETEPMYGKDIFVRMRRHYKQKFEQGVNLDDVI